jgi:predicted 3-demethylubiquinone-9 3-methyltransferase (glyoxalase superfamily)
MLNQILNYKTIKTLKMKNQTITPWFWFDTEAEEAANFYVSIFKNSKIGSVSRYGKEGFEIHGKQAGTAMTVSFQLDGQHFTALNGGPQFKFNEAISLQISCETQEEVDHYWNKLCEGGKEGSCGWLKDKYGVSWQVVPTILSKLLSDPEKSGRVTKAFLKMKKFDIESLVNA